MTTQLAPGRIGMPPPSATTEPPLAVVNEGDGKYRLEERTGAATGWINGHTVGLKGFQSVADALRAAPMLHQTLDAVLRQQHPEWRRHDVRYDALQLVHDGAYEWIAAGNLPLARVYRRAPGALPNDTVSVELVLPSSATEATILSAALAIVDCFRIYRGTVFPIYSLQENANVDAIRTPSRTEARRNPICPPAAALPD